MTYVLASPIKGTIGTEKFKATIHWRNGVLISDEPAKLGGKDLGPDPYTLLLSSLVSCTLATLRMYIEHIALPVAEIGVEANMLYRIENGGMVMHIERNISFDNTPDAEILQRLLEVAENCPVSKILKGTIKISTDIKSEDIAPGDI